MTGYAAYGQTFTEARGSWVQPTAHCALKGRQVALAAFWVGLDGYGKLAPASPPTSCIS